MNDETMSGKTIIVTGANRGLGREMTRRLSQMGARVVMACRSVNHAEQVMSELKAEKGDAQLRVMELDQADRRSTKSFAESFLKEYNTLDVLINNAGVQTPDRQLTAEGVELTFAINVLGPQLLTRELLPALKAAPAPRIVNVASDYAGGLDLDDINFDRRTYNSTVSYKQSKQANRMLTREWARRLRDDSITVNSMTPDLVPTTDLFRHQPLAVKLLLRVIALFAGASIAEGADTVVWLASAPDVRGQSGGYFRKRRIIDCDFEDIQAERKLWQRCAEMLGEDWKSL